MFCCNGILFNHESEHRAQTFVTRKITLAAARIAQGLQDKLYLGNLDSLRDWGYAKDYVECMWLILQAPNPEDFVIATGVQHSVREFAQLAFHHVGIELKWEGKAENEKSICVSGPEHLKGKTLVEVSPDFYRPPDVVNLCSILPSINCHVSSHGKSCSLWQTLSRSKRRTLHSKVQQMSGVLAWKMPGEGGGGYLALVVEDAKAFAEEHKEAIELCIRRG